METDESGPVELVLVEFPGNHFEGKIIDELAHLVAAGTIRLLDVLLIRKEEDGSVNWLEAEGGDARLAELLGEPEGFLSTEDVEDVSVDLRPGSSVGMVLFEHAWAARLATAVREADGLVLDWARVPAAAVSELRDLVGREG